MANWSEGFEGGAAGDIITTSNTALSVVVSGADGDPVFVDNPVRSGTLAAGASAVPGPDVIADFLYDHGADLTQARVAGSVYLDPAVDTPDPGFRLASFAVGDGTAGVVFEFSRAGNFSLTVGDSEGILLERTAAAPLRQWVDLSVVLAGQVLTVTASGTDLAEVVAVPPDWSLSFLIASVFDVAGNRSYLDALSVTEAPTVAPVCRLYPRDDGRGLSSAPRIYPMQRAGRIVGGHR